MPEHDVYIEAFWGRGTIAKKKRPAAITVGVDLDPDAISSGAGSALMFQCDSLAWLCGYFHLVGSQDSEALANATGCGGGRPPSYSASCPAGSSPVAQNGGTAAAHKKATAAGDAESCDNAGNANLSSGEYLAATFGGFPFDRHLVYLDPPYLGFEHYYKHRADHGKLIDLFLALPCPAMLSGYWSEYYAERLSGTRSISIDTVNRAGKPCTEWVWMNFEPPQRYHDVRFVGSGRRERERIKRRVANWSKGLAAMTTAERQAVFEACRNRYELGE